MRPQLVGRDRPRRGSCAEDEGRADRHRRANKLPETEMQHGDSCCRQDGGRHGGREHARDHPYIIRRTEQPVQRRRNERDTGGAIADDGAIDLVNPVQLVKGTEIHVAE